MSHPSGSGSKSGTLTDRQIAEDILTSQKYISNYYYAPAVLESTDPNLRNMFQKMHNETQSQAKQVFDYLNSRGWYKPRQADAQSVNDLRNAAQESKQILSSIAGEMSDTGGKSDMIGTGQQHHMGTQPFQTGTGWQSTYSGTPQWTGAAPHNVYGSQGVSPLSQRPGYGGYGTSFSSPAQSHGIGTGWQPTYSQTPQWTGTQRGEGQSGMGPSSLAQGVSWGGQPSWTQGGTVGTGWQPTYSQTPQWRGTQYGEGQSGMGPSSLAQGASWGGQPSWMQGGTGTGTGWQPAYSQATQWTGTQYGEGQSGMGPSSLAQWARWGGQPSWIQSQPGTQGQWR